MAEYPINKGIGRPVEFKGLKAQYLFIFCGGLLALFILFVILYMVDADHIEVNTGACAAECPKNISLSNIARLNREFIKAKLKD